jgi:hypothetical protein
MYNVSSFSRFVILRFHIRDYLDAAAFRPHQLEAGLVDVAKVPASGAAPAPAAPVVGAALAERR